MAHVLVVEPDASLRATLCDVLGEDGVNAVEVAQDGAEAADRLAVAPEPAVVVLNGRLGGFYSAAYLLELAYRRVLRGHRFVVLSTDARARLPRELGRWCALLPAPVVWMPFDTADLLAQVAAGALLLTRMAAAAAPDGDATAS